MKSLILIGASGHGKVVGYIALSKGYSISFFDDNEFAILPNFIVKKRNLFLNEDDQLFISIGNNYLRKKISQEYASESFINLFHSKSIINEDLIFGVGNVVMSGVCINSSVYIGNHCILNTSCVIEHDCVLENFVHISPNATLAGNVIVGEGSHIGIGALIIPGVKIGKWVTIGAGTVVLNDVPDYAVIVGNPGKIIRFNFIENE
jgi:sugar O-acyltransferase (sialic acid O-acetyltransferase NeuD family)